MLGFGTSERRQALVLGNSSYADAPLSDPKNDAESMKQVLGDLGFNVRLGIDLDYDATLNLFAEFENDLGKEVAKVGLLYYSGHGVQVDGTNYLMPVGAETKEGADFGKLVAIEPLIDRMANKVETRLIVLDACRSNPFAQRLNADVLRTKGYTKGFYRGDDKTPIKPNGGLAEIKAKAGTFIAFAASPGDVAYEGNQEYSIFTAGLLRNIAATDVPIGNLMMRVTDYVYRATDGKQNSWQHSSLRSSFFFNPGSLIMLVGNVIGLVAFTASLLPHSFSLHNTHLHLSWAAAGIGIAATTFGLFLAGLQRAYRLLRGEPDASNPNPYGNGSDRFRLPWRQGLFGGFFGGIIAAPLITTAYYFAWKATQNAGDPAPFGQLLTEIMIACVIIGLLLGLLALSFAEYFRYLRSRSPQQGWILNPFNGALLGGIIAGIICGPWTTLYFGLQDRPFVLPHILLIGAIPGTAVMIFSILNYSLEKVNLRTLVKSGAAALGSVLIVGVVFGILALATKDFIQGIADGVRYEWKAILLAGLPYGVAIGIVLGAVFGLTLLWTDAQERAAAK
jgi:caspase domain-containing protein